MQVQSAPGRPGFAAKIGDGDRDQGVNTGGEVERNAAGEYAQKGPDYGPAMQGPIRLCLGGNFSQPGRGAVNRQVVGMPLRISQGIAIHFGVAKFYGHPGRRVTADSCQSGSVKNNQSIFVGPQNSPKISFFAPAGQPGRFHGKVDSPSNVSGSVFPLLARVHHEKAGGI